jgi:hypothetical protein
MADSLASLFLEGIGHASTDDDIVGHAYDFFNELYLFVDLGPAQYESQRPGWIFDHLAQMFQLFFYEEAADPDGTVDSDD